MKKKLPYLEAILKVVVFFKKHGIVNDDLRSGDPEINDAIIHCLCGLKTATATLTYKTARTYIPPQWEGNEKATYLECAKTLFQVCKHGPHFQGLIYSILHCFWWIKILGFSCWNRCCFLKRKGRSTSGKSLMTRSLIYPFGMKCTRLWRNANFETGLQKCLQTLPKIK